MMTRTRVLAIALFVSVAFNLFFGGLMFGWHGPFGPPHGPEDGPPHMASPKQRAERMEHWLTRGLSEEARPIVRRLIAEHIETVEAGGKARHASMERVRAALNADPFDPAAYDVALDEVAAAHAIQREAMHTLMSKLAVELSPKDRKTLANRRRWRKPR